FGYLLQPSVFQTTLNIASLFVIAPIAAAVFVLPIIGIRDQIEQEKQHALDATSDMLQSARDDLHDKVRRRAYEEFRGIEDTIDALIQE
ncbi:MAG: hypothetical protein GTO63_19635, partial [Anaerolineae bacterium]|nr:hypothetical protein [Anaerolineae bacterium]NIQ79941.1 hypothetical protein [Anaerolineae bacterium]